MIDRLHEHRGAVLVEVSEHLRVGQETARADAHDEAAFRHVVDHGDLAGHHGRMVVGQVDRARAELDVLGLVEKPGNEDQGGRDRFRRIGHVLAEVPFDEAQAIRNEREFAILLERLGQRAIDRMDRHREEAKLHERHSLWTRMGRPVVIASEAVSGCWNKVGTQKEPALKISGSPSRQIARSTRPMKIR
jgi:hypothetical protein